MGRSHGIQLRVRACLPYPFSCVGIYKNKIIIKRVRAW